MKTKLHFAVFFILLLVSGQLQAQTQLWALTNQGGDYNEGAIIQASGNGTGSTVAFSFHNPEGFHPYGDLLQASDGNLYGTCYDGGVFFSCTVFRYEPSTGTYTDVYDFDIAHGDFPRSGLIEGPNQKLYGAATSGGLNSGGVIYSYDMLTGVYTDLFDMSYATGGYPNGSPILFNGKLYGTAQFGGINNRGVIYSYDISAGSYASLFDFDSLSGGNPSASLVEASNGKLYGVTTTDGQYVMGVIFSFDPATGVYTKLHDFDGTNGQAPNGALMQASNGLLYGMTSAGGAMNMGVIFSFDPATNVFTNLHEFNGTDGASPKGWLNQSGNLLCGSATSGGALNYGVIFNYDLTTNVYTKVMEFNGTNGSAPNGGFISYSATGIAPAPVNDISLSVFPNPVNNFLYVTNHALQSENTTVYLKDLSGKIVHSSSFLLNANQAETIDLTGYSKGMYLLEIKSAKGITTKKIVKT